MKNITEQNSMQRVQAAIAAMRAGKILIMVDDEDRENEGDLVCAASAITPEHINFMAKFGRGLICLTLAPQIVDRLKLPLMRDLDGNHGSLSTAFTLSIEAKHGVSTGISAQDRATTIQVAIDQKSAPGDLIVPGHVFPLRAVAGGVLERAGHTEGSVDLAIMAGMNPSAVICEIMNDDGTMARMPDLERFAQIHDLTIVSIADLITYRLLNDSLVEPLETVNLSSSGMRAHLFRGVVDNTVHFALSKGLDKGFEGKVVDVRVHHQRPLSDVFNSFNIEGRHLIDLGMNMLEKSESGVFLYLNKPWHPDAIKSDFMNLFKTESSTKLAPTTNSGMDQRTIGVGAQILKSLGIKKMRLFLRTPQALKGLRGFGLEIEDTVYLV